MSTLTRVIFDPDISPPAVPTGTACSATSQSAIRFSWLAASDTGGSGLAGYRVYRSTSSSGPFTQIAELSTSSTVFDDSGLSASTAYHYRVLAFDGNGNQSAQSATASATTHPAASTDIWAAQPSVSYLPAVPNGRGFGMNTVHCLGSGGYASPNITVLTVDRLTSSSSDGSGSSGSLAWCLTRNFPRFIKFDVSGTIALNGNINVDNDYLYLAGETAPSPGIFLRQGMINIRCSHAVVSHINSYMGGDGSSPARSVRDAFSVAANASDVVIANCSGFWACDETMQAFGSVGRITFWQCLMAEPLDRPAILLNSGTGEAHHGFGMIIGGSVLPADVSILRCAYSLHVNRHPLVKSSTTQIADCLVYNWGRALPGNTASPTTSGGATVLAMDLNHPGVPLFMNVESCVYLAGPDHSGSAAPIDSSSINEPPTGSRIFQQNNRLFGQSGGITGNSGGVVNLYQGTRIASAWTSYNPTVTSSMTLAQVVDLHRRTVGACPSYTAAGRRALQFTRMQNYLNGSGAMGQVYDEVSDISGGWGNIPPSGVIQNSIDHTASGAHGGDPMPTSNINQIASSGYPRIIDWVHRRYVEKYAS